MRPRTLARKRLKPVLNLFNDIGGSVAPCGLSFQQKAVARAEHAIERHLDNSLIVCALLYDTDELLARSLAYQGGAYNSINKDKLAAEFLKPIFPEHITKLLRFKSITQQYANESVALERGTAQLFEESPWFFSSMSIFQIEKKLLNQLHTHVHIKNEISSYEELLLSQTLILSNKETLHA